MQAVLEPTKIERATVLGPGEGESHWVMGERVTIKLGRGQTRGRFALTEIVTPPAGGPPPHTHGREDESFYVIDGELRFVQDDVMLAGPAGTAVYLPRGGTHSFRNVSERSPARFLVATFPSGFDSFLAAAGTPCDDPDAPPPPATQADVDRLVAACGAYGLTLKPDHRPTLAAPPKAADRELWVMGLHVRLKLNAADTGGNFSLAQITARHGAGVPPHLHHDEDEFFYVLAGAFEFILGDCEDCAARVVTASPGTVVHVPRGVLHGFRNNGRAPARLITYHTPGGFDRFFEEAGTVCTDASAGPPAEAPDPVKLAELIRRHGMEMPGW